MAIDVSVGTSTSESYSTVAELKAYAPTVNIEIPATTTDAVLEGNLRLAALALQGRSWRGYLVREDQRLNWPREGSDGAWPLLDRDVIPAAIKEAQQKIALNALGTTGIFAAEQRGAIISESKSLGPMSQSTTYASGVTTATVGKGAKVDPVVETLIQPYLEPSGDNVGYAVRG